MPQLPVLFMHGWKDSIISYAEAMESRDLMNKHHGMEQTKAHQGVGYRHYRFENPEGLLMELYTHDFETSAAYGHGHCFPNPIIWPTPFSCVGRLPLSWGLLVMDFFKRTAKTQGH